MRGERTFSGTALARGEDDDIHALGPDSRDLSDTALARRRSVLVICRMGIGVRDLIDIPVRIVMELRRAPLEICVMVEHLLGRIAVLIVIARTAFIAMAVHHVSVSK